MKTASTEVIALVGLLGLCSALLVACGAAGPNAVGPVFRTAIVSLGAPDAEPSSLPVATRGTTDDLNAMLAAMQPRVVDGTGSAVNPYPLPSEMSSPIPSDSPVLRIGNDAWSNSATGSGSDEVTLHGYVIFVQNISSHTVQDVRARVRKASFVSGGTRVSARVLVRNSSGDDEGWPTQAAAYDGRWGPKSEMTAESHAISPIRFERSAQVLDLLPGTGGPGPGGSQGGWTEASLHTVDDFEAVFGLRWTGVHITDDSRYFKLDLEFGWYE